MLPAVRPQLYADQVMVQVQARRQRLAEHHEAKASDGSFCEGRNQAPSTGLPLSTLFKHRATLTCSLIQNSKTCWLLSCDRLALSRFNTWLHLCFKFGKISIGVEASPWEGVFPLL